MPRSFVPKPQWTESMLAHKAQWDETCRAANVRCLDFVFHGFTLDANGTYAAIYTRFSSGEEIRLSLEQAGRPVIKRLADPISNGGLIAGRCAISYQVSLGA